MSKQRTISSLALIAVLSAAGIGLISTAPRNGAGLAPSIPTPTLYGLDPTYGYRTPIPDDQIPTTIPYVSPTPVLVKDPVVTKTDDTDDGSCTPNDCSLREAIRFATSGSEIQFDGQLSGNISLKQTISISKNVTMTGFSENPARIEIRASGVTIFQVDPGNHLSIHFLTLTGDPQVANSGGIDVRGGQLTISTSSLTNNTGTNLISVTDGKLEVVNTSIYANTRGGIIAVKSDVTIMNSTFYNNTGLYYPMISNSVGRLTLLNSVFAENMPAAPVNTANLVSGGNTRIGNTIIVESSKTRSSQHSNCQIQLTEKDGTKSFHDLGGNIQFPTSGCGASILVADPEIDAFSSADSDLRVPTLRFKPNSVVFTKGIQSLCQSVYTASRSISATSSNSTQRCVSGTLP